MCQSRGVDRVVLALVGERGVEIAHAVRELFATAGTERTVLVVASSELPPRARVRAALTATAIAEYFRDRHHERVLLAIDSLSRVARAQREVGLAVGELPVRQGYPPSVFELLPQLVERAGNGAQGRMSALYTLLSESELDDPMAAELASLVDGQLVLSARLAAQGFFPAIDVLRSLSRNAERLLPAAAVEVGRRLRAALATLEAKERLVDAGVVSPASDPELARLLALKPRLLDFLRQPSNEHCPREQSLQGLAALGL
mgnify:CR=1 FL=1